MPMARDLLLEAMMGTASNDWRIGCDIGGTFTDFFAFDQNTGAIHAEKKLTTPDDPSRAVGEGLMDLRGKIGAQAWKVDKVIHGTTLVINALIQQKGARVGLLATEGFKDIIEMRREVRYDSYDLFAEFPKPLVDRSDRRGIKERILADGSVLVNLQEDQARAQIADLIAAGVGSFAVCLLHSYANPRHEQRLRELILEMSPRAFVSLSSEVLPEIREYERTVATAANAFVQPQVATYLDRMVERIAGAGAGRKLQLMQSNGGLSSVEIARALPLRMVESGPAAGSMAAEYFSRALARPNLLSFDMGGTTAKSVLIKDGRVTISNECEVGRVARFKKGSGIPLKLPFVDLLEIGAGGGSIARLSSLGLIQVGPDSASSVPGPVCYGRGGEMPTVTDADLLLGFLNKDFFLGGEMKLDLESARQQIARHFRMVSSDPEEAAWRIHNLVNENMASAAKIHLAEKGQHPSGLSMIALGGAGPVHAVGVARQLGIPEVIVPPWAGVLSALGFFAAPTSFDLTATFRERLTALRADSLADTVDRMKADIARFLDVSFSDIRFSVRLDVQYVGQGVGVTLTLDDFVRSEAGLGARLQALFEAEYHRLFGRIYRDVALEVASVHVVGSLEGDEFRLPGKPPAGEAGRARKETRQAYSPSRKRRIDHAVYDRALLPAGHRFEGPALVEERETTTLVGEGMSATVHETGALIIRLNP